jgi:glycerol uptake facilitator protein
MADDRSAAGRRAPSLASASFAELVGTFILVFFGCGSVHAAVLSGAQSGVWQVAIVWGVAVMLAVYCVGGVSGAHLNPAITLALAAWGSFAKSRVLPYLVAQLAGAFLAAAALYAIWQPALAAKEQSLGLVRGQPGSELTASCYGEYYPNPGGELAKSAGTLSLVTEPIAFFAEVLGTAILALVVLATTDERNRGRPPAGLAPVFIGLTVAALISIIGPLTQACLNPARDWGPRLFAYLAGWGDVAIPGPNGRGVVTVYIIAPIVGAQLGAALYRLWLGRVSSSTPPEGRL